MSGLSGTQLALRSERIVLPQFHHEALRPRSVEVAFGMPDETLLGVICHSVHNATAAGQFFARISTIDEPAVQACLRGHYLRLNAELDLRSGELRVKPESENSPMDFPRPSPTLHIIQPVFVAEIAAVPALRAALGTGHPTWEPRKPEKPHLRDTTSGPGCPP